MLYLPPIMDPVYGFEAVNVEAQSRAPASLLNWTKRLIAARRTRRALGRGTLRFLYPSNRKVIAYLREWESEVILVVANLARTAQAVELDLSDFRGRRVIEVLGRSEFPVIGENAYMMTLQGHSFFWFELAATAESESVEAAPLEFVTLVMQHGWGDLFTRHNLPQLERDVIPAFLPRQRWFGAKDQRIRAARVVANGELPAAPGESGDLKPAGYLMQVIEASLSGGERQLYALPLAACWSPSGSDQRNTLLPATLAELRQSRREGTLVDAASQDGFALALLSAMERQSDIVMRATDGRSGSASFRKTPLFAHASMPERLVVRRLGAEQSNTSVLFEEYGVLKLYRRLQPGVHPEIEMVRFLVERAGFANTPPLLGTIEMSLPADPYSGSPLSEPDPGITAEGRRLPDASVPAQTGETVLALGLLFGFVRNQGDGWSMALNYLSRYLDDALNEAAPGAMPPDQALELPDPDLFFLGLARQLGLRTGEMHRALAEFGDDPAFAPEPITRDDIAAWRGELRDSVEDMLGRLRASRDRLPEPVRELADQIVESSDRLEEAIGMLAPDNICAVKCRHHGDYHLGQVLAVQNDFYIIDFEGEPSRPMGQRRRKNSPLRDVAGMIRSFDYATSTAVRQIGESRPASLPRAAALAESWRERAVAGFRAAYRKATRFSPVFPANKLQGKALIDFFTLEKAVYEVRYELANRPDWLSIPLAGVLRVLAKTGRHS
jgi:maltose alpha-D-glucosyltransferase/alpha-amylase